MSIEIKSNLDTLYKAQQTAGNVNYPSIFPCYAKTHLQDAAGLKGIIKNTYAIFYTGISCLAPLVKLISYIASAILSGLEKVTSPILDVIMPINPVNGKRQFAALPRKLEIILGKAIISSITAKDIDVSKSSVKDGAAMEKMVHDTFHKLAEDSPHILNPCKSTPFQYKVRTIYSEQINAFAVMGGGMIVNSKIVQEIYKAVEKINNGEHKGTEIEFADGSVAKVDMTGVTAQDAMAALMGHEMTHVASRHSIKAIFGNIARLITVVVARIFVVLKLQTNDTEYQSLKNKKIDQMTAREYRRLQQLEKNYSNIGKAIGWLGNKVGGLFGLHYSRKAEYEADITGIHLAKNAGFDARGGMLLQEILLNAGGGKKGFMSDMQRRFEWLFTHPHSLNRIRGAFAAMTEIDPAKIQNTVTWEKSKEIKYDLIKSGAHVTFAGKIKNELFPTGG